ncbi:hypothetical protein C6P40_000855 [Pichia californica]|uniref:LSM2-LSM8 complex subunit LSM8 n=1 Tax=Pichia californica TaxID=460514 RepID=A0A9P6WJZ2_9ASCO|nr:hypothetical protein C6P42_003272 [[Candida] californica]KAG0688536.1 hypothetical protein C6P40_000855 [[Candida] californica]
MKTADVKILTADGKLYIGNLEGYDQNTNVILSKSKERQFSKDKPSKEKSLGGIVIRGDDVLCVGKFDEDTENSTDYTNIFAENLKDTKNPLKGGNI